MKQNSLRPYSSVLVDGPERAAARAMLYPVGFTEADFKELIIGIASTWSNVTPCNMHIDKLALEAEKGADVVLRSREREKLAAGRMRVVGEKPFFAARAVSKFSATPSPSPTAFRWAAKA